MSKTTKILIGLGAFILLLFVGCSALVVGAASTSVPANVSNVSTSAVTSSPLPQATTQKAESEDLSAKFGQAYRYSNGMEVSVSAPSKFRPSEYTSYTNTPAKFTVKFTNNSDRNLEGGGEYLTASSGEKEAEQIFDSESLGESPSTILLPGKSLTFNAGFDVSDINDVVLQITPYVVVYDKVVFSSK